MHKMMSGKAPPSNEYIFFLISHDILEDSVHHFLGLTVSSLACYILAVFRGTHSLTLLDYHRALKRLNRVTCQTLCADWLSLHVKHGNCNPSATFYLTVSHSSRIYAPIIIADFRSKCRKEKKKKKEKKQAVNC